MKRDYTAYLYKIKQSGIDGNDPELYQKPEYFDLIHEIEHSLARHNPTAHFETSTKDTCTEFTTKEMSSTIRRKRRACHITLEELDQRNEKRSAELMKAINFSNQHKADFNAIFAELVEKIQHPLN